MKRNVIALVLSVGALSGCSSMFYGSAEEKANALYQQAQTQIEHAELEDSATARLAGYQDAVATRQRIIEKYPTSSIAVGLTSGQMAINEMSADQLVAQVDRVKESFVPAQDLVLLRFVLNDERHVDDQALLEYYLQGQWERAEQFLLFALSERDYDVNYWSDFYQVQQWNEAVGNTRTILENNGTATYESTDFSDIYRFDEQLIERALASGDLSTLASDVRADREALVYRLIARGNVIEAARIAVSSVYDDDDRVNVFNALMYAIARYPEQAELVIATVHASLAANPTDEFTSILSPVRVYPDSEAAIAYEQMRLGRLALRLTNYGGDLEYSYILARHRRGANQFAELLESYLLLGQTEKAERVFADVVAKAQEHLSPEDYKLILYRAYVLMGRSDEVEHLLLDELSEYQSHSFTYSMRLYDAFLQAKDATARGNRKRAAELLEKGLSAPLEADRSSPEFNWVLEQMIVAQYLGQIELGPRHYDPLISAYRQLLYFPRSPLETEGIDLTYFYHEE
uniref:hypothetical protein n=1 Tax=Thaumasiovibrio occultus TaxID=1891184 RepID=UPI000B355B1B|nr:hypothetical protein [Thaumasiovibrio occultus]